MTIKEFFLGYLNYLQILILGLFFYLLVWLMLNYLPPAAIANWGWPDGYLPFQLVVAGGNFFTGTFFAQNRRFGLWLTLTVGLWLFFILAHFVLTPPLTMALITTSLLLFGWLVILPRKKLITGVSN